MFKWESTLVDRRTLYNYSRPTLAEETKKRAAARKPDYPENKSNEVVRLWRLVPSYSRLEPRTNSVVPLSVSPIVKVTR